MGVQQSAVPPCFGALYCAVVQGSGSLSRPEARRQGGGAGVYSGSFPVWASADCPDFPKLLRLMPEVTPPCACVHSPPCPACRPAKPRAWRLKTATTLPGGKAAIFLRLRREYTIIPSIWTAHTTRMDTITYGIRIQTYSHVHSSFPTWTGYAANTDRVFHPYGQESPNKYSA